MGYLKLYCPHFPRGPLWHHNLYLSLLSILSLFLFMVYVGGLVSFFACPSPVAPTPFIEEAIFTPLYAHVPFVKY